MSPSLPMRSVVRPMARGKLRVAMLALALVTIGAGAGASFADAAPRGPVAVFSSESPAGLAVDQTSGDVYVVDVNNERVVRRDADGAELSIIGGPGSAEGQFFFCGMPTGVAVGPDGSVYVADTCNHRVQQFTADGTFVRTWGFGVQSGTQIFEICTSGCQPGLLPDSFDPADSGDGQFWTPRGVAVDPGSGDVLVGDTGNHRIQRFASTGVYESQFTAPNLSDPTRLGVDSTGAIYVVQDPDIGATVSMKLDASGAFVMNLDQLASAYDIAVDPVTDHVFGVQAHSGPAGGSEVLELDSSGALIETHLTPPQPVRGLAVHSASGRIYTADNSGNQVFVLDDPVHTATIQDATAIESRSATLNGTINPGGGLPVFYHFEVSADEGQTWTSFPETDAGPLDDTVEIPVSELATGLEPNREYRVRLVARNELGFTITSTQTTFTTATEPPDATTLDATQLTTTGATLAGQINPNNAETTYHFEWGNTTDYGNSIPLPEGSAGAGGSDIIVTERLAGLLPNTVYHYRIVATSLIAGTTEGADRTFQTRATTDSTSGVAPPGRNYELVSPAYKPGGVGAGIWYAGPAASGTVGTPAYVGDRFAVQGNRGSTVSDGPVAYGVDWAFSERTDLGWMSRPGMSRRPHGNQLFIVAAMEEATEDLSLTSFTGNFSHLLKLFPEMEPWDEDQAGAPLFIRDWTGDWELVGPLVPTQSVGSGSGNNFGHGPKAFADDGSAIVASAPDIRGLAGAGDPTSPTWPDLACTTAPTPTDPDECPSSVYLDEIVRPFTGSFPGDDGRRVLVNLCTGGPDEASPRTELPTGVCAPRGEGRDEHLISDGGASLSVSTSTNPSPRVISSDGSRIFFMSPDPALNRLVDPTQVYVRQRNADRSVVTRWISRSEVPGQSSTLTGAAYFEGASRDGDKVLFRTTSPLTADDPNGGCGAPCTTGGAASNSADLYMYDLPSGDDPAGGDLTRISGGPDGTSDCNSPREMATHGALRFASDDASRVYFICTGSLAGSVESAEGTITSPEGTPSGDDASNLYVFDANRPESERWRFIARLPRGGLLQPCATTASGNSAVFTVGAGAGSATIVPSDAGNCFSGTADGSLVTFFTDGRLTADDPDAATGDIYGYDAARDELFRITAPQGGVGDPYDCAPGMSDSPQCFGDGGMSEQGSRSLKRLGVATRPSDGSRLAFFESRSQLVPADVDDAYDVYQWREGDLTLISTGKSNTDGAFYAGNDRSGRNVYIATRDRLSWQDTDAVMDIYAAREGGGIPQPPPPVVCAALADECQGVGAAAVSALSTSSLRSSGNALSKRHTLSLRRLSLKVRRRAARTGVLTVSVRTSKVGVVRLAARARIGGKPVEVARAHKRVRKAGVTRVALRLSLRARRVLGEGRTLRMTVRASQTGVRTRSTTVTLKRGKSS